MSVRNEDERRLLLEISVNLRAVDHVQVQFVFDRAAVNRSILRGMQSSELILKDMRSSISTHILRTMIYFNLLISIV